MLRYFLERLATSVATAALVLVFVFVAARATGNPFDLMYPDGLEPGQLDLYNAKYGLDRSYPEQFWLYLTNAVHGDFGMSLTQRRPVTEVFFPRLLQTLKLGSVALAVSLVIAIPLGMVLALFRRNPVVGALGHVMSVLYAAPGFVVALILVLLFGYVLRLLPTQGAATPQHYVLPAICLSIGAIVSLARYVDNGMREVIHQDYIRTATSLGFGRRAVVLGHALPNTWVPVVTQLGMIIVDILSGTVVIETIFSWPGMGTLLVDSVINRDFPVIQFSVVAVAVLVITINLLLDVVYLLLDPRIGRSEAAA